MDILHVYAFSYDHDLAVIERLRNCGLIEHVGDQKMQADAPAHGVAGSVYPHCRLIWQPGPPGLLTSDPAGIRSRGAPARHDLLRAWRERR
jgi:hypothetical protein